MALEPNIQQDETYLVIKEIKKFRDKLHRWATQLQVLAILLPSMAIVLSATIGSFATDISEFYIRVLAFLAALCGVLATTFQVERKAKDMRDSFRYLNFSLYMFTVDADIEKLIKAYNQTESMVGHIQVHEDAIQSALRMPRD